MKKLLLFLLLLFSIVGFSEVKFKESSFCLPSLDDNQLINKLDFYIAIEISGDLQPGINQILNLQMSDNSRFLNVVLSKREKAAIMSCVSKWKFRSKITCKVLIKLWLGRPFVVKKNFHKRETIWNRLNIYYFQNKKIIKKEYFFILNTNLITRQCNSTNNEDNR